jgi:hypothetical protein
LPASGWLQARRPVADESLQSCDRKANIILPFLAGILFIIA